MSDTITLCHQLETLVDTHSLTAVLDCLASICGEKSDHISSQYQDKRLAAVWSVRQHSVEKLAARCRRHDE